MDHGFSDEKYTADLKELGIIDQEGSSSYYSDDFDSTDEGASLSKKNDFIPTSESYEEDFESEGDTDEKAANILLKQGRSRKKNKKKTKVKKDKDPFDLAEEELRRARQESSRLLRAARPETALLSRETHALQADTNTLSVVRTENNESKCSDVSKTQLILSETTKDYADDFDAYDDEDFVSNLNDNNYSEDEHHITNIAEENEINRPLIKHVEEKLDKVPETAVGIYESSSEPYKTSKAESAADSAAMLRLIINDIVDYAIFTAQEASTKFVDENDIKKSLVTSCVDSDDKSNVKEVSASTSSVSLVELPPTFSSHFLTAEDLQKSEDQLEVTWDASPRKDISSDPLFEKQINKDVVSIKKQSSIDYNKKSKNKESKNIKNRPFSALQTTSCRPRTGRSRETSALATKRPLTASEAKHKMESISSQLSLTICSTTSKSRNAQALSKRTPRTVRCVNAVSKARGTDKSKAVKRTMVGNCHKCITGEQPHNAGQTRIAQLREVARQQAEYRVSVILRKQGALLTERRMNNKESCESSLLSGDGVASNSHLSATASLVVETNDENFSFIAWELLELAKEVLDGHYDLSLLPDIDRYVQVSHELVQSALCRESDDSQKRQEVCFSSQHYTCENEQVADTEIDENTRSGLLAARNILKEIKFRICAANSAIAERESLKQELRRLSVQLHIFPRAFRVPSRPCLSRREGKGPETPVAGNVEVVVAALLNRLRLASHRVIGSVENWAATLSIFEDRYLCGGSTFLLPTKYTDCTAAAAAVRAPSKSSEEMTIAMAHDPDPAVQALIREYKRLGESSSDVLRKPYHIRGFSYCDISTDYVSYMKHDLEFLYRTSLAPYIIIDLVDNVLLANRPRRFAQHNFSYAETGSSECFDGDDSSLMKNSYEDFSRPQSSPVRYVSTFKARRSFFDARMSCPRRTMPISRRAGYLFEEPETIVESEFLKQIGKSSEELTEKEKVRLQTARSINDYYCFEAMKLAAEAERPTNSCFRMATSSMLPVHDPYSLSERERFVNIQAYFPQCWAETGGMAAVLSFSKTMSSFDNDDVTNSVSEILTKKNTCYVPTFTRKVLSNIHRLRSSTVELASPNPIPDSTSFYTLDTRRRMYYRKITDRFKCVLGTVREKKRGSSRSKKEIDWRAVLIPLPVACRLGSAAHTVAQQAAQERRRWHLVTGVPAASTERSASLNSLSASPRGGTADALHPPDTVVITPSELARRMMSLEFPAAVGEKLFLYKPQTRKPIPRLADCLFMASMCVMWFYRIRNLTGKIRAARLIQNWYVGRLSVRMMQHFLIVDAFIEQFKPASRVTPFWAGWASLDSLVLSCGENISPSQGSENDAVSSVDVSARTSRLNSLVCQEKVEKKATVSQLGPDLSTLLFNTQLGMLINTSGSTLTPVNMGETSTVTFRDILVFETVPVQEPHPLSYAGVHKGLGEEVTERWEKKISENIASQSSKNISQAWLDAIVKLPYHHLTQRRLNSVFLPTRSRSSLKDVSNKLMNSLTTESVFSVYKNAFLYIYLEELRLRQYIFEECLTKKDWSVFLKNKFTIPSYFFESKKKEAGGKKSTYLILDLNDNALYQYARTYFCKLKKEIKEAVSGNYYWHGRTSITESLFKPFRTEKEDAHLLLAPISANNYLVHRLNYAARELSDSARIFIRAPMGTLRHPFGAKSIFEFVAFLHTSAARIQRCFRQRSARVIAHRESIEACAATKITRWAKACLQRKKVLGSLEAHKAVHIIIVAYRQYCARRARRISVKMEVAARKIQQWWRGPSTRKPLRVFIATLQPLGRGLIGRNYMRLLKSLYFLVIFIKAKISANLVFNYFIREAAVKKIQNCVRTFLQQKDLKKKLIARSVFLNKFLCEERKKVEQKAASRIWALYIGFVERRRLCFKDTVSDLASVDFRTNSCSVLLSARPSEKRKYLLNFVRSISCGMPPERRSVLPSDSPCATQTVFSHWSLMADSYLCILTEEHLLAVLIREYDGGGESRRRIEENCELLLHTHDILIELSNTNGESLCAQNADLQTFISLARSIIPSEALDPYSFSILSASPAENEMHKFISRLWRQQWCSEKTHSEHIRALPIIVLIQSKIRQWIAVRRVEVLRVTHNTGSPWARSYNRHMSNSVFFYCSDKYHNAGTLQRLRSSCRAGHQSTHIPIANVEREVNKSYLVLQRIGRGYSERRLLRALEHIIHECKSCET